MNVKSKDMIDIRVKRSNDKRNSNARSLRANTMIGDEENVEKLMKVFDEMNLVPMNPTRLYVLLLFSLIFV